MAKQLHKRFSTEEVKIFLKQYLDNKKKLLYILEILQITKRRFFHLLQEYRENPDGFSIDYKRKKPTRKINEENLSLIVIKSVHLVYSKIAQNQIPVF